MARALRWYRVMKRISVGGDESISAQARTYAEYRMFAALTRYAPDFRRARVALRARNGGGSRDPVSCSVTVAFEPSASVRIRTTGPHPYAAINRAVDRLADTLGAEFEHRRSS